MDLDSHRLHILRSWGAMALISLLCVTLAVLQYRWTGDLSRAEKIRQQTGLESSLQQLSRELDSQIGSIARELTARTSAVEALGREEAHIRRWKRWKDSGGQADWLRSLALVVAEPVPVLLMFDPAAQRFAPAPWPERWQRYQERFARRVAGGPPPTAPRDLPLFEFPRFRPREPGAAGPSVEDCWLVVELDLDYLQRRVLPELVARFIDSADYEVEIHWADNPALVVYRSGSATGERLAMDAVDASAALLGRRSPGPPRDRDGRWRILARHHAGSLDAVVARTRWRNLGVSLGLLALMLASVGALMRFSGRAQRLADLQMDFVAGVSHELRTPLTVIRTAAFNLKGRVARSPEQVERYGALILGESEKLTSMVEEVLRFARAQGGQVIGERHPVTVDSVLEASLRASGLSREDSPYTVEENVEPGLPMILADETAIRHALRNLFENAVKYGTEGSPWIGVTAVRANGAAGDAIEIRITDRGPGIPDDEQPHVFDAFFRGRRPVSDQIHGTGLGLNLVKKIVEAHGGSVSVSSAPMKGTEFTVRLPVAPEEMQDEFANSVG